MLSNYLRTGQAHFHAHLQKLTLSFTDEELRIDRVDPRYQQTQALSLTHCRMTSLAGIEQF
jgi:hypothetical protein